MKPNKLQMADVARLAGVSTATVSRALSGSDLISPKTKARILDLAGSLGYTVNISAQNLRLGENRTIGVIIPSHNASTKSIRDPFLLLMIGELASVITEANYDMLLSRIDEKALSDSSSLYTSGKVAGMIVIGQGHMHDELNTMASRRVPLVVWGAKFPQQLYCSIGSDNAQGGALAAKHLIEKGAKSILFLGDTELPEVAFRFDGFTQEVAQYTSGVKGLHCSVPFEQSAARAGFKKYLKTHGVNFDAIFAASDLLAFTAIGLLAEQGVSVPRDVLVVGFDDIETSRYYSPTLTSVRQPLNVAAPAMLERLLSQIEGKDAQPQTLTTELIVRQSSTRG